MSGPSESVLNWLKGVPTLKSAGLQKCIEIARARVKQELGAEPAMPALPPEPEPPAMLSLKQKIWLFIDGMDFLDYMLVPLVIIMAGISLIHQLHFSAEIAAASYVSKPDGVGNGIWLDQTMWVLWHQGGFFSFSELVILIFYTRYEMEMLVLHQRQQRRAETETETGQKLKQPRFSFGSRLLNGNLWVACIGAVIAIIANVSSLLHGANQTDAMKLFLIFFGASVPVITMFVGHRFAALLKNLMVQLKARLVNYQEAVRQRLETIAKATISFEQDYDRFRRVMRDPTLFDLQDGINSYRRYLATAIVEHFKMYMGKYTNLAADDWTPEHEKYLAGRELARMRSFEALDDAVDFFHGAASE